MVRPPRFHNSTKPSNLDKNNVVMVNRLMVVMVMMVMVMIVMRAMMVMLMMMMMYLTSGFGGSVGANWRSVLSGGQMLATDCLHRHDDDDDDDDDDNHDDDGDDGDDNHGDDDDANLGKVASWRVLKANLSTSMFLTQLNRRVPSLWMMNMIVNTGFIIIVLMEMRMIMRDDV